MGAASRDIPPPLLEQLASPGKLIIPVGPPGNQSLLVVDRNSDGKFSQSEAFRVSYIPLCDEMEQRQS